MPPKISFMNPPIFKGTNFEDALDWIERYEAIGQYNRWENEQLAANFGMYLDGPARKWFLCNTATLPNHWPPRAVAAVLGVNQPDAPGLRSRFLSEFQQENYALFQETKLRNRVQGEHEEASTFYYDVLGLCRQVDPAMTEPVKLDYLYRGLKPSLMEKIYTKKPKTSAELLNWIKLFRDAKLMSDRRTWDGAVSDPQPPPILVATVIPEPVDSENIQFLKLQLKQLQEELAHLQLLH